MSSKIKKYLLVTTVILILVLTAGLLVHRYKTRQDASSNTSPETAGINYTPPTKQEEDTGNQQKNETIQKEQERSNTNSQNKKNASVIITDAGQYDSTIEVRAFIPDHYQDGTCVITLTNGNYKVSKSTPAYRDVSTTICTNPLFTRSDFPVAGKWQAIVNYSSQDTQGVSDPKSIDIN